MKDGELIESGTHTELMAKQGEYCALYGVQAKAFTEPGAPGTVAPSDRESSSVKLEDKS